LSEEISLDALVARLRSLPPGRHLLAVAGPPGSGKSHVSSQLAEALGSRAAVVPMDGFHFDDKVLEEEGLLSRKGAPETFDVGGLAACLRRLRGPEEMVAVPVFDRDLEISRGSARLVRRAQDLVIVEGNYLLFNEKPWDALAGCFDLTLWLDVPEAVLAARLRARWEGYGLPPETVRRKVGENDLPNARRVVAESRPADMVLRG